MKLNKLCVTILYAYLTMQFLKFYVREISSSILNYISGVPGSTLWDGTPKEQHKWARGI